MAWKIPTEWKPAALSAAVFAGLVVTGLLALVGWMRSSDTNGRSLVGGCEPFNVYAQNQFQPAGTLVWASPSPVAENQPAFAANQLITVDGWVRTRSPYPSNSPPWDSDAWFHLANDAGWVSFGGVRAVPTTQAESGESVSSGYPAPLDSECMGTFRSQ
jgi:hypothetical protein